MINFAKHPCPPTRAGYDKVGRAWFMLYLQSLKALAAGQDASNGKLNSARKAFFTKLYVTTDLYTDFSRGCSVQFFNVRASGQDYRIVLGFDNRIVRVETLDAKAAQARTQEHIAYWSHSHQPVAAPAPAANGPAPDGDEDFYNVDSDDEDNYNTAVAGSEGPYGVRIPADSVESPYGVWMDRPSGDEA